MRKKRVFRRILLSLFIINQFIIGLYFYYYIEKHIPNEIKMVVGTQETFDFNMPVKANIVTGDIGVISVNDLSIPSNEITIDMNEPFTLETYKIGKYHINLKLFGIFNFKNISLDVIQTGELIPCGTPIGIYVETSEGGEIFLTSLENYDEKYVPSLGRTIDDWKMRNKWRVQYSQDEKVWHVTFKFEVTNWQT